MKLSVAKEALNWFENEYKQDTGILYVRLFPQYGGFGSKQKGYAVGFSIDVPDDPGEEWSVGPLRFFYEKNDEWYFGDSQLAINVNKSFDEIFFSFD
ncbi:HesB/YadR/YfhF family protein [Pseudalkalibacillus caeni]|uniref:FeS cluster biogenesis domain-containing protein n=1 Tax=Exobacillus caeni TaxID=2574798 RepID=A0A5R9EYB4_9BACL|nr:hypothetical protein [Pseudalkalibacillus caeni]TLS35841.1 hypothetical protein FCL54_18675 [Pseudalkalibacillus caeni]